MARGQQSRKNRVKLSKEVSMKSALRCVTLCFIIICVTADRSNEVFEVGTIVEGKFENRWYTATILRYRCDPSHILFDSIHISTNDEEYDVLWHVDGKRTTNLAAEKIRRTQMSTCTLCLSCNSEGRQLGLHHSGVRVSGTVDNSRAARFNIQDGWIIKEVNAEQVSEDTTTEELKILLNKERLTVTFDCHGFGVGNDVEARKRPGEWSRARITNANDKEFEVEFPSWEDAPNNPMWVPRQYIRRPHNEPNWSDQGKKVVAAADYKGLEKGQTAEIYGISADGSFHLRFNGRTSQKEELAVTREEFYHKFVPVTEVGTRVQATEDLLVENINKNSNLTKQRIPSESLGVIEELTTISLDQDRTLDKDSKMHEIYVTFDDYGPHPWWVSQEQVRKLNILSQDGAWSVGDLVELSDACYDERGNFLNGGLQGKVTRCNAFSARIQFNNGQQAWVAKPQWPSLTPSKNDEGSKVSKSEPEGEHLEAVTQPSTGDVGLYGELFGQEPLFELDQNFNLDDFDLQMNHHDDQDNKLSKSEPEARHPAAVAEPSAKDAPTPPSPSGKKRCANPTPSSPTNPTPTSGKNPCTGASTTPAARTTNQSKGESREDAGSNGASSESSSNHETNSSPKSRHAVASKSNRDVDKSDIYIGSGTGGGTLLLALLLWLCCRKWFEEGGELENVEDETPGVADPNIGKLDLNNPQPTVVFSKRTPKETTQSIHGLKPITLMTSTKGCCDSLPNSYDYRGPQLAPRSHVSTRSCAPFSAYKKRSLRQEECEEEHRELESSKVPGECSISTRTSSEASSHRPEGEPKADIRRNTL